MTNVALDKLFGDDILKKGVKVFAGGRDSMDFEMLTKDEEATIREVFQKQISFIETISPQLAVDLSQQEEAFVKLGGVAKAVFPGDKGIKYPGEVGSIAVDWLTPQNVFWKNTAAASDPCYNGYTDNTWDVDLVAGTEKYLFGSSDAFYKSCYTDQKHSLVCLAQNGLVEVGTTPKVGYMNALTQSLAKYAPFALHPLIDLPVEKTRPIYQYNTPGIFAITPDFGHKISVMPHTSGTSRMQWFGLVFYEYDYLSAMTDAYRSS